MERRSSAYVLSKFSVVGPLNSVHYLLTEGP